MKIQYPLIIDGGLSNVLESQGHNLNHDLWSAKLLIENEDAIIDAHASYLNAGAKCIITSSYQASIPGLIDAGFTHKEAEDIIKKTVELAERAIQKTGKEALIAASIGPYGAYLSDGSEYEGNYGVSIEMLKAFHASRIIVLEETNCDIYACETIPSFEEAKVLGELMMNSKKKAWISFSCKNEQYINDGTPIAICANHFADHPNIFAIGVNCTNPQFIPELIQIIKANCGDKRIVVYPNSGEIFDAEDKTWKDDPDQSSFCSQAQKWLNLGADIVGGCCRIGPDNIQELKNSI